MSYFNVFRYSSQENQPFRTVNLYNSGLPGSLNFQKNAGYDPVYPHAPIPENITNFDAEASNLPHDPLISGQEYVLPALNNTQPWYITSSTTKLDPVGGNPALFLNQQGNFVVSGAGTGDVSSNIVSSTVGNMTVFADTSGKLITESSMLNVAGPILTINDVPYQFPSIQGVAGSFLQNDGAGLLSWLNPALPQSYTVTTSNNTPTSIFQLATSPDTSYILKVDIVLKNITQNSSGIMTFSYRIDQGLATTLPSTTTSLNKYTNLDVTNALADISTTTAPDLWQLDVIGVGTDTINWKAQITIISQN